MRFSQARGLWRHRDFMKMWTGQTISEVGSTITREAIPWTALLLLSASPWEMGLLAAAGSVPVLLVSLVVGVWVDRLRRRPLMIVADLARALLLLTIPVLAAMGLLRLTHLFIVTALVGTLSVLFDVAYLSFVPTLVTREHIAEANSKLGISGALAEVIAPGLGGFLVQLLTAPIILVLDAVSFLVSATMIASIRSLETPPVLSPRPLSLAHEVSEGLHIVLWDRILRALVLTASTESFFGNFYAALYGVYAFQVLGLGPALLGLAVAAGGAGSLIGAVAAPAVLRRHGIGSILIATQLTGGIVGLLTPFAGGPVLVATAMLVTSQFCGDALATVHNIVAVSIRQTITPDHLLGRVNAGMQLLVRGVGPLGAITGGALAMQAGPRIALLVATVGGTLSLFWLVRSPVRVLKELPSSPRQTGICG